MRKISSNKGYVALISVLIIGAIGAAVATSIVLLGLGSSLTGFGFERSIQARGLADACIEEALQQIRNSTPFTGSGSLTFGQGTCDYTVTSQGGQNRTITAIGAVAGTVRKAEVVINQINPDINVVYWQEVVDL